MNKLSVGQRIRRRVRYHLELVVARERTLELGLRNRRARTPLIAPGGPVVSLTTHGTRILSVHHTIEAIGGGTLLPSRLVLWLDDEKAFANLPVPLLRLKQRGLEVLLTRNYGPHTKYYPYVASQSIALPLVTADDDILYPPYWLERLAHAFKHDPEFVHCYRAHVLSLTNGEIAPYEDWKSCKNTEPSFLHFATGVSGVIYPPRLLRRLKEQQAEFEQQCPKADDIWLHVNALRGGFQVCQIAPHPLHFLHIPGTQEMALNRSNVAQSANDEQIRKTYKETDLAMLRANLVS